MIHKLILILIIGFGLTACNQDQKSETSSTPDEVITCGRASCKPEETIAKPTSVCNDTTIPFVIQRPFQITDFFNAEEDRGLTMRFQLIGDGNDMSAGSIRAKILCFDKNELSKTTSFQYTMTFSLNGNKVIITTPQAHQFEQEPTSTKVECKMTIPASQIEFEFLSINSCLQLKSADKIQLLTPTNNF